MDAYSSSHLGLLKHHDCHTDLEPTGHPNTHIYPECLFCRLGPEKRRLAGHDSSVTGIAVDACNKVLVSTGLDQHLRVWGFKQQALQGELHVGSPVACMAHHPATSLVAAAGDDLHIRM